MVDEIGQDSYSDRFFSDLNTRIRDLEEKQRLTKDRISLIGESFIKERDKTFFDIQSLKKIVTSLEKENIRLREVLSRVSEIVNKSARKEELAILQRQFDIFRI